MNVIITGANGTLGSEFVKLLKNNNINFIAWSNKTINIKDFSLQLKLLREIKPDFFYHFAVVRNNKISTPESYFVNVIWPAQIALFCSLLNIKFIFTSTSMVFSTDQKGPFTINSMPEEVEGYGFEKRIAEQKIIENNSNSLICRLGWQIGISRNNNTMNDYFENMAHQYGEIKLNENWFPSCSFINDTIQLIHKLSVNNYSGIYLIDSNDRFNIFQIGEFIKKFMNNSWILKKDIGNDFDHRMMDSRVEISKLSDYLK